MFGLWIFRVLLDKPWGYSIDIFFFWGGGWGGGVGGLGGGWAGCAPFRSVVSWKTSQDNTVSILFTFPSGVCDVFIYRFK